MESLLPSGQFILSEEDSLYNRNRQGKRKEYYHRYSLAFWYHLILTGIPETIQ